MTQLTGLPGGNPNFGSKITNQEAEVDYVIIAFELFESELEKFKKLCPDGQEIGVFVEKILRAYLKRPVNHWSPVQDFSGQRTRLFARVPTELHAQVMRQWAAALVLHSFF